MTAMSPLLQSARIRKSRLAARGAQGLVASAPGDRTEQPVDGYVADLVRGDELIEIQTRNFGALKRKLSALLQNHAVRYGASSPHCAEVDRAPGSGRDNRAQPPMTVRRSAAVSSTFSTSL